MRATGRPHWILQPHKFSGEALLYARAGKNFSSGQSRVNSSSNLSIHKFLRATTTETTATLDVGSRASYPCLFGCIAKHLRNYSSSSSPAH